MASLRRTGGSGITRYRGTTARHFNNPFFKRKRHVSKMPKAAWCVIGFTVCVAAASYVFFFTNILLAKEIDIRGARLIPYDEIAATVTEKLEGVFWFRVPKRHAVFIPKGEIAGAIGTRYPVRHVASNFILLHRRLEVTIVEREPAARIQLPTTQTLIVDAEGRVVYKGLLKEAATSTLRDAVTTGATSSTVGGTEHSRVAECTFCDTLSLLPLIKASSTFTTIEINQPILTPLHVTQIKTAIGFFSRDNFNVASVAMDNELPDTIEVQVADGFEVYFDTSKAIEAQYARFKTFIDQKFPKPPRKLHYVDVRYGNRLYYQ